MGNYQDANGMKLNWIQYNFFHTILAADLTIVNKIITEVYNAEFDVVNFLMDEVDAEDFKYDEIDAKVLPKSNYVFLGEAYEAEIIVAAYDTKQNPDVYLMQGVDSLPVNQIDRAQSIEGENGVVRINLQAEEQGLHKFAGIIRVKTGVNEANNYFFEDSYFVAEPSLIVSAKKMNVFYIGVDNPVAISVPGIPEESLTPTVSNGELKPDPESDDWIITVPGGIRETVISVTAEIDGKVRDMGSKTFRIKKLPDPTAMIANRIEGSINRNILIASGAIVPKMPDDFQFPLQYRIVSFKMVIQRGQEVWTGTANNNRLSEDMIRQIRSANRGQKIWFENIVARGPDNLDRPLSPIIFTIN